MVGLDAYFPNLNWLTLSFDFKVCRTLVAHNALQCCRSARAIQPAVSPSYLFLHPAVPLIQQYTKGPNCGPSIPSNPRSYQS